MDGWRDISLVMDGGMDEWIAADSGLHPVALGNPAREYYTTR